MKLSRTLLLFLMLAFTLLLSACSGSPVYSWPGVTAGENAAYLSNGQYVYSIDLNNGSMKWRFPEKGEASKLYFAAPALTEDGQVIVGNYGKELYSINAETGKQNWVFLNGKGRYIASPLVNDGKIYAPNADGSMYVLNLQGAPQWSFKTKNSLWANPAVNGAHIYLPSMDHFVYAVRPADGKSDWAADLGGATVGAPAVGTDGILYQGTLAKKMQAVDTATGKVIWSVPTNGGIWNAPLLKENKIYFGDLSGTIYALNTSDGSVAWQLQEEGPIIGTPALTSDGNLVVTNEKGAVIFIDADGKIVSRQQINGKLYSSPVIAGDHILISALEADKILYALDNSGREVWSFVLPK